MILFTFCSWLSSIMYMFSSKLPEVWFSDIFITSPHTRFTTFFEFNGSGDRFLRLPHFFHKLCLISLLPKSLKMKSPSSFASLMISKSGPELDELVIFNEHLCTSNGYRRKSVSQRSFKARSLSKVIYPSHGLKNLVNTIRTRAPCNYVCTFAE